MTARSTRRGRPAGLRRLCGAADLDLSGVRLFPGTAATVDGLRAAAAARH